MLAMCAELIFLRFARTWHADEVAIFEGLGKVDSLVGCSLLDGARREGVANFDHDCGG